jgi:hypothetical protein
MDLLNLYRYSLCRFFNIIGKMPHPRRDPFFFGFLPALYSHSRDSDMLRGGIYNRGSYPILSY